MEEEQCQEQEVESCLLVPHRRCRTVMDTHCDPHYTLGKAQGEAGEGGRRGKRSLDFLSGLLRLKYDLLHYKANLLFGEAEGSNGDLQIFPAGACREVARQQCATTQEEECEVRQEQVCRQVPSQECRQVPRTQREEECAPVVRERCREVPQRECRHLPRERCSEVPRRRCRLVQREVCTPDCTQHCEDSYWCKQCRE